MEKIEQLLNSLIEKGWCPIWRKYTWPHKPYFRSYIDGLCWRQFFYNEWWDWEYEPQRAFTLRELTSINSGLWQFVCENGMVKRPKWEAPEDVRVWRYTETMGIVWSRCFGKRTPEFYIMESALKDESKLEEFLLSNIKVDE